MVGPPKTEGTVTGFMPFTFFSLSQDISNFNRGVHFWSYLLQVTMFFFGASFFSAPKTFYDGYICFNGRIMNQIANTSHMIAIMRWTNTFYTHYTTKFFVAVYWPDSIIHFFQWGSSTDSVFSSPTHHSMYSTIAKNIFYSVRIESDWIFSPSRMHHSSIVARN